MNRFSNFVQKYQKILLPSALISVIIIAGVFAFYPVEKASTVHGTLASSSGLTSAVNAKDMVVPFQINFSYVSAARTGGISVAPAQSGVTYSGFYFLSAVPDHVTTSGQDGATANFECGISDDDGNDLTGGINATTGTPKSGTLDADLTSGDAIIVGIDTANFDASTAFGGVCQGVIFLDDNSG